MLADPNILINQSGLEKIKKNLLYAAKKELWKDAQGEDLPDIDREVIVIDKRGKVSFGHRPDKKHGYLGKSMLTNNIEKFYPHTYDKGGWNIPDIRWWLDVELPNMEEQQ